MHILSWIVGLVLSLAFLVLTVANAWSVGTYMFSKRHISAIPLLGGVAGLAAAFVLPIEDIRSFWWLPLVVDYGSIPMLVAFIVSRVGAALRGGGSTSLLMLFGVFSAIVTFLDASTAQISAMAFHHGLACGGDTAQYHHRGRQFAARDGSGMTFMADNDVTDAETPFIVTGDVRLKDGTRFHVGDDGRVQWMSDRNGNLIQFVTNGTYGRTSRIAGPLGRMIDLEYSDDPLHLNADLIKYKGSGGIQQTIFRALQSLGGGSARGRHSAESEPVVPTPR